MSSLPSSSAEALPAPAAATGGMMPLFVDLDGTLLATDMLWEAACIALRRNVGLLWHMPRWTLDGRAVLKRRMAERYTPDVRLLPYRTEVLEFLKEQKAQGRLLILATANDRLWADAVNKHLGLFDAVIASQGETNLKGAAKLAAIEEHCRLHGYGEFAYLGDSSADLPIWRKSAQAYLAAPSKSVATRLRAIREPAATFGRRTPLVQAMVKVMRPHQWVKNLLVFLPIMMAHRLTDWAGLLAALWAFAALSLFASAVYVLNDLLDIEADRHHPVKCRRPFAAGKLPLVAGPPLAAGLVAIGTLIAWATLPVQFLGILAIYLVTTLLYSFWLKRVVMVDVMLLAGLYTLRVLAGGVATDTWVSEWLMAMSMFLFTSLAFAKRYVELSRLAGEGEINVKSRGYLVSDLSLIESMGPTAGYISVLVLALYIHSGGIDELYPNAKALWLICPLLMYWISRLWLLAKRHDLDEDPVVFAIKDRVSLAVACLTVLLAAIAVKG